MINEDTPSILGRHRAASAGCIEIRLVLRVVR